MRAGAPIALAALALVLALPAPAGASRVLVSATTGPSSEEFIHYRAAPGERNRVRVHLSDEGVVIVDRGVERISIGGAFSEPCRSTSRQRVVCPPRDMWVELRGGDDSIGFAPGADLGAPARTDPLRFADRDDSAEEADGGIVQIAAVLAGPGDDRIVGTRYEDYLVPGPGRDVVDARGGADTVVTEADGVSDRLRGGGGADGLEYSGGTPVTIDQAAGTGGAPGEADTIRAFERVHGGSGADVLRGDEGADALYGGPGDDLLEGRDGSDLLVGESNFGGSTTWPNRYVGGAGDDFLDAADGMPAPGSTLDCGPGDDVMAGEYEDLVDGSCESSAFVFRPFRFRASPHGARAPRSTPWRAAPTAARSTSSTARPARTTATTARGGSRSRAGPGPPR
jgi:hypothetical protein